MPSYRNNESAIIDSDLYSEVKEKRGIKTLRANRTVSFKEMQGQEVEILNEHTWAFGDTLIKLSLRYFNNPDYWWTIGILNKKPTDAHYSYGDIVFIPRNPQKIDGSVQ